jgi:hypothetical protein
MDGLRRVRLAACVWIAGGGCFIACGSFGGDGGNAAIDASDDPPVTEAGTDADAEAGVACDAGTNAFCENFDTVDTSLALGPAWGATPTIVAPATFDIVETPTVSPPHAALLTIPSGDGGLSPAIAVIQHVLPAAGDVSGVSCDLDIWVDAADLTPSAFAQLLSVSLKATAADSVVTETDLLLLLDPGLTLRIYGNARVDGGATSDFHPIGTLGEKAWWHVHIEAGGGHTTGHVAATAAHGGVTGGNATFPTPVPTALSSATITLGFAQASARTGWSVAFDNLVCVLTP